MVADALDRKSWEVLPSVTSREWQMLKAMGKFGLHYRGQAQSTLRSLMATPSLISRVIESRE